MLSIAIGLLVALIAFSVISINNKLVRRKNKVDEAFAAIDVYFEKRSELIPNLVAVVQQQSKYEAETLEKITAIRSSIKACERGSEEQIGLEKQMSQLLANFQMTAEDYPELRANEGYCKLQNELSKIEADLSAARRFYNAAVNAYNNGIEEFPSNLIASAKGFRQKLFFETDKKGPVNVKGLFND